jgi:long-chain acyl-CoA synthetase
VTGRNVKELNPNARLEPDLGLSSLDRVELLGALEDRYQVSLIETQVSGDTTVAELERLIGRHGAYTERTSADSPQISRASRRANSNKPRINDYPYPIWAQRWPATWIRAAVYTLLTWPATLFLAHPRVRGHEYLRGPYRPLLVVSNHITPEDIGFIAAALPFRYRYRLAVAMGGERLRAYRHPAKDRGFFGALLDRVNYFLVTLLFNVFPLPKLSGLLRRTDGVRSCPDSPALRQS